MNDPETVQRNAVRDYYETGSGAEVTLHANEEAWQSLRFRPRILRDVSRVGTAIDLLGASLPHPLLVAPSALHGLGHPDGERATARGAAAAGALMVLSMRSSVPAAEVGREMNGSPWWYQVYATGRPSVALTLTQQAVDAGASAIVLTGDTPIVGRKRRATPGIVANAMHVENLRRTVDPSITAADVTQDPSATLDLIRALADRYRVPVLVKGVLRGDDARLALEAGAAGVIVSNHGGRQLDRAIASADALPEVVAAVDGAAPVIVDGGIRSGVDAMAALALGADAVMLGRPILRALMAGGSDAIRALLDQMRTELVEAMQLVGTADVDQLTPDLVVRSK
ncbi:alpha-hydroxy acid oxidase [Curtobacterium ammoniigenes]|uniref:alpha-hydroxy acid oxidase n=1 Tax=Curtobacterium ammoniigenes TaxID=395387 RepID=UPI000AF6371B|nr:alpha-hydroxy acid oxidase [Curtobacterium ammoniigenes]